MAIFGQYFVGIRTSFTVWRELGETLIFLLCSWAKRHGTAIRRRAEGAIDKIASSNKREKSNPERQVLSNTVGPKLSSPQLEMRSWYDAAMMREAAR